MILLWRLEKIVTLQKSWNFWNTIRLCGQLEYLTLFSILLTVIVSFT